MINSDASANICLARLVAARVTTMFLRSSVVGKGGKTYSRKPAGVSRWRSAMSTSRCFCGPERTVIEHRLSVPANQRNDDPIQAWGCNCPSGIAAGRRWRRIRPSTLVRVCRERRITRLIRIVGRYDCWWNSGGAGLTTFAERLGPAGANRIFEQPLPPLQMGHITAVREMTFSFRVGD